MTDNHVRRHRIQLLLERVRSLSETDLDYPSEKVEGIRSVTARDAAVADLTWLLDHCPKGRGKRVAVGAVSVKQRLADEAALRCRHWMRLHRDRVNILCDMGLEYVPTELQLTEDGYIMMRTGDRTETIMQDGIPLTALMVEALIFYGEAKIESDMLVFNE